MQDLSSTSEPSATAPHEPDRHSLEVLVGRWKTKGETLASGTAPVTKIDGTDVYEWLAGGFFLLHWIDVHMGEEHVQGLEIIAPDSAGGGFVTHSFDSQGNAGTYKLRRADRVWTLRADDHRATIESGEDGRVLNVHWQQLHGAEWRPWMDLTLTKQE